MYNDLSESIRRGEVILFVGAGASTGLGAPPWSGLIAEIGRQLGYDEDVFASLGSTYLALAEYYKIKEGRIGPLRSWMDTNWHVSDTKLKTSRAHRLITELSFKRIYTTNYDRYIESAFRIWKKPFHKISNITHMVTEPECTQIIKLHGDFDDDKSLVLTESDYFDRLSFESPLDIKLRSDALGKSILFIGYSLSDINIRLLLYKLSKLWGDSGRSSERPKSYLFLTRPDEIQRTVLGKWGVEVITADTDDPNIALCAFLEELLKKPSSARA